MHRRRIFRISFTDRFVVTCSIIPGPIPEIVDGLFHLYPKDISPDADGNDLNATANGSFYLLYSRLGIDVAGPSVGKAKTTAKLEVDFRGSGSNFAMIRVRHAYVNLDWGKSAVLIGQTWHPLFGDIFPQMLNLSTGAPFQPFSRNPMLRYRYTNQGVEPDGGGYLAVAVSVYRTERKERGIYKE